MRSNRVLVTGANGFIGRHLCRTLVEAGKDVVACIREESDSSPLGDLKGSLHLLKIPSQATSGDLLAAFDKVDAVVHLAGRAHVMHETAADPLQEFRKANVQGTSTLALAARSAGVRRFIFVSSIKVNGELTDGTPFHADDPHGYTDPYGQSKWEAEESLRQIAGESQMDWVIVRPPLVYGPGVRGNFLSLLKCVARGIPLPIGGLDNKRSIVSVYNLNNLLCLLLDHPRGGNNRFLVCDPQDVSTPDLVRGIAGSLHRSARIVRFPKSALLLAGVVFRRQAAIQRLSSSLLVDREKVSTVLGWTAPMPLHEGLDRTADWYRTSNAVG